MKSPASEPGLSSIMLQKAKLKLSEDVRALI